MNSSAGTTNNSSAVTYGAVTANGTYYVNLTVIDNATNSNTTSFTVYVDQSAPVINSLSPSSVTTSGATITVNASDVYSGIINCTYSYGAVSGILPLNSGSQAVNSSGVYTANLSGLSSNTAYTVNVTCYDKAGYSVSNTTSFTTAIYVAPPSGGNSNGGGSTGGSGSGSSTSTQQTTTINVDVGLGQSCAVIITREMTSTTSLSKLTTTLENTGGSGCSMTDFVFADTIPADFPALNEVTFNPQYSSRDGWTVRFNFPTFAAGESKTLTYSANQWIRTSIAKNFTVYTMTAWKQQATVPANNTTAPNVEAPSVWIPHKLPVLQPEQPSAQITPAPADKIDAGFPWWLVLVMIVAIGAVGGVVFLLANNKKVKSK